MKYEICLNGLPAGSLQIRQEGLYEILTADCAVQQGVYRLYAETEDSFDLLGIPAPVSGKMHLCRRFPKGRLPDPETALFFLSTQEPWEPFSGEIAGIGVTDVCFRRSRSSDLYCESVQMPGPLALLPFFSQCRSYRLYGQRAILLERSSVP